MFGLLDFELMNSVVKTKDSYGIKNLSPLQKLQ